MQFTNKTIREAVKDWRSDSVQARSKWGPMEEWDTSQVTDMSCLFRHTSFSTDLSEWDTSRVTNMEGMFYMAPSFSTDLSRWDTSQVTDMSWMFSGTTSFSADLSQWDVSRVTNMGRMVYNSGIFHKWELTTLKDIPRDHAYRKAYRIQSFGHFVFGPSPNAIDFYLYVKRKK